MAASLLGYFCAMVTACVVFMVVLSHPVPPTKYQQPYLAFANTQIGISTGSTEAANEKRGSGARLSAHRASARAARKVGSIVN